jgi:serine/threonine protein kinase
MSENIYINIKKIINKSGCMGNDHSKRIVISDTQWEVGKKIGSGAFSDVHELVREDKKLAVKIVNKYHVNSELDCIAKEMEILAELTSYPYIISFYASINAKNELYFVTELSEMGSLYDYMHQERPLGENVARFVAHDMVNALYFMHRKKIIHRDIKPHNILIRSNNQFVLSDFNCSIDLRDGECKGFVTSGLAGSFEYMSPEMLTGNYYGVATDMWSLGIVLHEVVCNIIPWENDNECEDDDFYIDEMKLAELDDIILEQDNKRLIALIYRTAFFNLPRFSCSDACYGLIAGLLNKDPSKRLSAERCLNHAWVQNPGMRMIHLPERMADEDLPSRKIKKRKKIKQSSFVACRDWINPEHVDMFRDSRQPSRYTDLKK